MLARPQLTILKPKVRQYPQAVLCQTATTGTQPRKARLRASVKAPVYAEDLRTLDASLSFQVIDQWDLIVGKTVNPARVMGSEQFIFSLFTLQGLYYWKHSLERLISLLNEWMNRHILRPLDFSTDRSDVWKAKPTIGWFSFLPFFLVSFSFSCSRYQCISAQVRLGMVALTNIFDKMTGNSCCPHSLSHCVVGELFSLSEKQLSRSWAAYLGSLMWE